MAKQEKVEKFKKEVNVKELKANFRTVLVISIFASLVIGLVGGYFTSIQLTDQARADWISAQNAVVSKTK